MKCRVLKPIYFNKFKCIGSECEDNCCDESWGIEIDKKTFKKYMKIRDKNLAKKFRDSIIKNKESKSKWDYGYFRLKKGKCDFLNDDNLCGVYGALGEDYMCYVCRKFPRAYNLVNKNVEKSLTTACIEVARLILLNKEIMEFELDIEDINVEDTIIKISLDSDNSDSFIVKNIENLRSFSIDIIQNRKFSIEERLIILGLFIKKIEENREVEDIVQKTINEFNYNIDILAYDNLSEKINLESSINTQFIYLHFLSSNVIGRKFINDKTYYEFLECMVESLEIEKNNKEKSQQLFVDAYKNEYKNFISDKEYIYENFLVNYMFSKVFPLSQSLTSSYIDLVSNFCMIKLNAIGLCAYYKEDMNIDKLVRLIQLYSKVNIHDRQFIEFVMKFFEENNINTVNHMILMIGK